MNKQQIKAELRRSACEDKNPWHQINDDVWHWLRDSIWIEDHQALSELSKCGLRVFYLLVAETL